MTAVAHLGPFRSVDGRARGLVTLRYETSKPFEVAADFGIRPENGQHVVWYVARDVLADGLVTRSGLGDFICWTEGAWFFISLHGIGSRTGRTIQATIMIDCDLVRAFLIDAEDLVPVDAECADFDAQLSMLLIGGV